MLENKWNNIAPEVPQDFHNKFEDTLKQIEQADSIDKKYKSLVKIYKMKVCNSTDHQAVRKVSDRQMSFR